MIRVTLESAAVGTGVDAALPPVSTRYAPGAPTLFATEGGTRPTVLSLVASGRMGLDAGTVTAADLGPRGLGSPDAPDDHDRPDDRPETPLTPAELRRRTALIDTPLVAEHPADVSVATVVREELAFATRGATVPASVPTSVTGYRRFGSLSGPERLTLLIELALQRPDVDALVVTSPERHGGEPTAWWRVLCVTAARGIAVLVVTDHATVAHLSSLSSTSSESR